MEPFGDNFIPAPRRIWSTLRTCPACSGLLQRVTTSTDASHLRCSGCGHCWNMVHGRMCRVDPIGCAGCCADRKRECLNLLQREFPRFGLDDVDEPLNAR
jgi:hypothetical protein